MEQTRRYSTTTTLLLLVVLLLLFSSKSSTVTSCRQRTLKQQHLSTSSSSSSSSSPSRHPPESRITPKIIIISILSGIVTGLVSSLGFAILVRFFVRFMKQTPILKGPVIFSPKISPKTLQAALASEDTTTQLLGSNPNGRYHRTVLENGLVVAVKRLGPLENGSPEKPTSGGKNVRRRVQKELEILAGLRHRNLMSLRAYVRESDGFSLVYDYVSSGSLEDVMGRVRANEVQLGWEIRLRIAVGVVKGLQYLHFTCVPQILHCKLKPANVMLDGEFEPRLADCGLAKITPNSDRPASGYSAPESFQNNRYTDKSDIFSFGMILALLLTGRGPTDPLFGEAANGDSLGKWLRQLQQAGEAREALDKGILGEEVEEDEMLMAVRIAIICLSDFPADRPSSDELVHMLTQLHSF